MPKEKDNLSLAYTCWNCKYHIVFAPKYRRQVFFKNKIAEYIRNQLKMDEEMTQLSIDFAEDTFTGS